MIFREDANGLPVCVAEGSDGTAELQETISFHTVSILIATLIDARYLLYSCPYVIGSVSLQASIWRRVLRPVR